MLEPIALRKIVKQAHRAGLEGADLHSIAAYANSPQSWQARIHYAFQLGRDEYLHSLNHSSPLQCGVLPRAAGMAKGRVRSRAPKKKRLTRKGRKSTRR